MARPSRPSRPCRLPAARTLPVLLAALLLLTAAQPARAIVGERPPRPQPATAQAAPLDPAALAGFLDAAVPRSLARHHVPGATVAIAHAGEVAFARGYGMADVERGTAFEPATSMVRIASISKLFTWTAVMQLVEDGVLDLDRDVNAYLQAFQVPDAYPGPVTLRHLMTHTAGFEERGIGIAAHDRAGVPPLGDHLAGHLPARVRPPGEISAYSNHGAALAGHIVAEVSGLPYERYVADRILRPLRMTHTTAWEPVPEALAGDLARSYTHEDGRHVRVPFVYDKLVPDGSISASAVDMAHFMLAHLGGGRFGDARILDRRTARLMHTRAYRADASVSGWAHGFKERVFNGHRVLMHDGSWEQFQSALILVPALDLGVFVSYNGDGGIAALGEVLPALFDDVLPPAAAPEPVAAPARPVAAPAAAEVSAPAPGVLAPAADQIPGFYRSTRSSRTTIEKILTLVESSRARVAADGTLTFAGRAWTPTGPGRYRQVGGDDHLAAVPGRDGTVRYLATDGPAYEKLAWYETTPVNLGVLLAFVAPALLTLLAWPAGALLRRLRGRPAAVRSRAWRGARRLRAAACFTGLCFVVLFALTLVGDTSAFLYGVPLPFRVLMLVPPLFLVLAAGAVAATVRAWRAQPSGPAVGAHHLVVLTGLLALAWFLWQWNLIGWRFG